MIYTGEGNIKFEKNEPLIRSCPRCNKAHEHLLNVSSIHVCFDCGKYWIKGKYLDDIKSDQEFEKFCLDNKDVIKIELESGRKLYV